MIPRMWGIFLFWTDKKSNPPHFSGGGGSGDSRWQVHKSPPSRPKPDYEANFFAAFLPSKFFNSVPENVQEIVFNFN
jgi:hypothetical protein